MPHRLHRRFFSPACNLLVLVIILPAIQIVAPLVPMSPSFLVAPTSRFIRSCIGSRPFSRGLRVDDDDSGVALRSQPGEGGGEREREEKKKKKKKKGYQFGDISRSFAQKFTSSVKDVTGKEDYAFGDLSRWVDARVKDKVNTVTGKESYAFGDLSRWADSRAKDKAMEFTNKTDYEVGDISKEIFRKVRSGDYTTEDILLLCRVLVTMGVSLSPVAASLPGKLLVEMLDFSLAQELGGRFVSAITLELDRRMKQAVTGDSSYELGDLTKKAFLKFTDKESYEFGDITKTVLERIDDETGTNSDTGSSKAKTFAEAAGSTETKKVQSEEQELVGVLDLDPKILEELLEWDKMMIAKEEVKHTGNSTSNNLNNE